MKSIHDFKAAHGSLDPGQPGLFQGYDLAHHDLGLYEFAPGTVFHSCTLEGTVFWNTEGLTFVNCDVTKIEVETDPLMPVEE